MYTKDRRAVLIGVRYYKHGLGSRIDNRRGVYAENGRVIAACARQGRFRYGRSKVLLKQLCTRCCVKRINRVVLGRDINKVVSSLIRDVHSGHDEWLRIDLFIYNNRGQKVEVTEIRGS